MAQLATPRQVIGEIKSGANRPHWVGKVFGEVEQLLTAMKVIDEPMSSASIEALLEEAVERVMRPATDAELLAELEKIWPVGSA